MVASRGGKEDKLFINGAYRNWTSGGSILALEDVAYDLSDKNFYDLIVFVESAKLVAEPGWLTLLGLGMPGLGIARRRAAGLMFRPEGFGGHRYLLPVSTLKRSYGWRPDYPWSSCLYSLRYCLAIESAEYICSRRTRARAARSACVPQVSTAPFIVSVNVSTAWASANMPMSSPSKSGNAPIAWVTMTVPARIASSATIGSPS